MGYVFLYFYGLERRALIDKANIPLVREEVIRLLHQYGENRSFFGYASSFLAYISATAPLQELQGKILEQLFSIPVKRIHEDILALGLAWLACHERPLSPRLAFETARLDQRSKDSIVVKRTEVEFRTLFEKKYQDQCGVGMTLRTSKTQRKIEYLPASPTIAYESTLGQMRPIHIPDVLGISSQFKGLTTIWNDCVEELKPLSRQRAKGTEPKSRGEYEALPVELRNEMDHPDKPLWDALFIRFTDDRGRCEAPISELASLVGISERPKLTQRQSIDLLNSALTMGVYLEPSPHTILRPYQWTEPVALVRAEELASPHVERYYLAAALMLEMGTAMAAADGTVEKVEMLHVSEVVNRMFRFRADEARRLGAYRSLLIRHPPSLTGLGKRLKTFLKPEELAGLGEFLVGVAASNGIIESGERQTLQKAYKALGVPLSQLHDLLSALESPDDGPPIVQRAEQTNRGEPLPPRTNEQPPAIRLNRSVLEGIISDTAQVAVLIGRAMGELENTPEVETSTVTAEATNVDEDTERLSPAGLQLDLGDLEPRYHAFVKKILEQECWARETFTTIAQDFGHMVNGAVDAVNLWADETLGDFLIEENGNAFVIQLSILEEGV